MHIQCKGPINFTINYSNHAQTAADDKNYHSIIHDETNEVSFKLDYNSDMHYNQLWLIKTLLQRCKRQMTALKMIPNSRPDDFVTFAKGSKIEVAMDDAKGTFYLNSVDDFLSFMEGFEKNTKDIGIANTTSTPSLDNSMHTNNSVDFIQGSIEFAGNAESKLVNFKQKIKVTHEVQFGRLPIDPKHPLTCDKQVAVMHINRLESLAVDLTTTGQFPSSDPNFTGDIAFKPGSKYEVVTDLTGFTKDINSVQRLQSLASLIHDLTHTKLLKTTPVILHTAKIHSLQQPLLNTVPDAEKMDKDAVNIALAEQEAEKSAPKYWCC